MSLAHDYASLDPEARTFKQHDVSRHDSDLQTGAGDDGTGNHPGTPAPPGTKPRFQRYIPRAMVNTLGPLLYLGLYVFIVVEYLRRPAQNGIIEPKRAVDANIAFFAWAILSIFVLDWARSGIAGFEAAAFQVSHLMPSDTQQLLWHADKNWGSLTGWWTVLCVTVAYALKSVSTRQPVKWIGPRPLWFYLALSSFVFFAAVPLAGLSMNPDSALRLGRRPVVITGTNQTNFDARTSNDLAEQTDGIWRAGNPTKPFGPTVFYAPDGTQNASDTYFEDRVQTIYQDQLAGNFSADAPRNVTFFSGPEVSERAYGSAWGFLSELSCTPVHPYEGLDLLQVKAINNWTADEWGVSSEDYGTNLTTFLLLQQINTGVYPVFADMNTIFGLSYQYVMASTFAPSGGASAYTNETRLPVNGVLELVMWQSYGAAENIDDDTFANMSSDPLVARSTSVYDNQTYLGYGVQCRVMSTVGRADLSAVTNTFSAFEQDPAVLDSKLTSKIVESTAVIELHGLAYTSFTTVPLVLVSLGTKCPSISLGCNGWVGANKATNGVPTFRFGEGSYRYPSISPPRMALALSKLLGETAAQLMATGPGNWTSVPNATSSLGLFGLEPENDLVAGPVPFIVVLVLLSLWVAVTVPPQLWPAFLYGRRWGATLDGATMFRLGTEWKTGGLDGHGVAMPMSDVAATPPSAAPHVDDHKQHPHFEQHVYEQRGPYWRLQS